MERPHVEEGPVGISIGSCPRKGVDEEIVFGAGKVPLDSGKEDLRQGRDMSTGAVPAKKKYPSKIFFHQEGFLQQQKR